MSEDSTDSANEGSSTTSTTSYTRKTKKDELFGFPKDDLTLGLAAAAGIGVLGLAAKTAWDMMQNGQLPNPFAPPAPRISYSDVQAQQDWERQQTPVVQQQQPAQPVVEGGDPNAQTMPALNEYQGFDDVEDGVSYSTAPPKKGSRFDRVNMG